MNQIEEEDDDLENARATGKSGFLSIRLKAKDRERLRVVVGFMLDDPQAEERISFSGAIRYSLRRCVENPPAHVPRKPVEPAG